MVRHELRGHVGDRAVGGLPRCSIGQPARRTPRSLRLPPGQGHSARVQYELRRPERGRRRRGQGPSGKSRVKGRRGRAFADTPGAKLSVEAATLQFLGPDTAIERGTAGEEESAGMPVIANDGQATLSEGGSSCHASGLL
jgi:hypothetical protein